LLLGQVPSRLHFSWYTLLLFQMLKLLLLFLLLLLLLPLLLLICDYAAHLRNHGEVGNNERFPPSEQPKRVDLAAQTGCGTCRLKEFPVANYTTNING